MGWELILIIILVLILIGVIPIYPHSRSWGYVPGGLVTLLIIILVIILIV